LKVSKALSWEAQSNRVSKALSWEAQSNRPNANGPSKGNLC